MPSHDVRVGIQGTRDRKVWPVSSQGLKLELRRDETSDSGLAGPSPNSKVKFEAEAVMPKFESSQPFEGHRIRVVSARHRIPVPTGAMAYYLR
ncbi:hypothetical protein CVT25_002281 [Psilocybe cyanescens]|uniref:Uncharacterized protein n=1 Tax=Psilocybe cyanescens TaxID=93625 RepID=A0A409X6M5_PSICY|nr:hypothetical protein CVT25_002281 [Psilocybe cyanescens]